MLRGSFLFVVLLTLIACKKESTSYSTTSARDHAVAELNFSDVFKVVDAVSKETEGIRSDFFDCIESMEVDTLSQPHTVQVHFGQTSCTDENGVNRTGSMSIEYSARYLEEGTTTTVALDGYRIDGFLISGTLTIVNLGINQNDLPAFTFQVENGAVKGPNNTFTIQWETNQYREWVEGSTSPWLVDDEFRITGTSNGVNRDGSIFTSSIRSALRTQFICPWVVSGSVEIEEEGPQRLLDYGDGTCDDNAVVTANEQETQISL